MTWKTLLIAIIALYAFSFMGGFYVGYNQNYAGTKCEVLFGRPCGVVCEIAWKEPTLIEPDFHFENGHDIAGGDLIYIPIP